MVAVPRTTASEALLRRRARGFRNLTYIKLKTVQLNTKDKPLFLFNKNNGITIYRDDCRRKTVKSQ